MNKQEQLQPKGTRVLQAIGSLLMLLSIASCAYCFTPSFNGTDTTGQTGGYAIMFVSIPLLVIGVIVFLIGLIPHY